MSVLCHIWYKLKKRKFVQTGSIIYHPELIFEEVLNIWTEIWNYTCSTCCDYFYLSAILQGMGPLPDVDDLYIILTRFSRRFWIWLSKFEILSLASAVTIVIFLPHYKKCESHCTSFSYPFLLYCKRSTFTFVQHESWFSPSQCEAQVGPFSMNLKTAHLSVKLMSAHLGINSKQLMSVEISNWPVSAFILNRPIVVLTSGQPILAYTQSSRCQCNPRIGRLGNLSWIGPY